MELTEIMVKLNAICLKEFKENYANSEMKRIFMWDDQECHKMAVELQAELQSKIKDGLVVRVSDEGTMTILKSLGNNTYQELHRVFAKVSKLLPYSYVMGKAVSKKAMLECVANIEQTLGI